MIDKSRPQQPMVARTPLRTPEKLGASVQPLSQPLSTPSSSHLKSPQANQAPSIQKIRKGQLAKFASLPSKPPTFAKGDSKS